MADKRLFTVVEAEALIPALEVRFSRVMQLRVSLRNLYRLMEDAGYPPTPEMLVSEGGSPDVVRLRGRFRALMESLTEELAAVEEMDVAIKDLDLGLCDFLGQMSGREVWLCWQYGEKKIEFWHELDSGFGSRQPINQEARAERLLH